MDVKEVLLCKLTDELLTVNAFKHDGRCAVRGVEFEGISSAPFQGTLSDEDIPFTNKEELTLFVKEKLLPWIAELHPKQKPRILSAKIDAHIVPMQRNGRWKFMTTIGAFLASTFVMILPLKVDGEGLFASTDKMMVKLSATECIDFGDFKNMTITPTNAVCSRLSCQLSSTTNDFLFVVPPSVATMSPVAFVGPFRGIDYPSSGTYRTYQRISDMAVTNIVFLGTCPTETNDTKISGINYVTCTSYGNYSASAYWYYVGQFSGCTCWYIEGEEGWTDGDPYYDGKMRPGAARVTITPSSDNGKCVNPAPHTVTLSCMNPKSVIHYTVDGTDPTTNSPIYTIPIEVMGITTVKAIASVPDYPFTIISSCSYAQGEVSTPVITSSEGMETYYSNNMITLQTETVDAVIHYTIDGTEPTKESALYKSPFAISKTTTVKAKAFKENWFDSDTATVTFTRYWNTVETPVIVPNDTTFENIPQAVEISCETADAEILYTVDGSDPVANGRVYKGAFMVYESCTIRAIARKFDWKDSGEAVVALTRAEPLGEAVNLYGYLMETDTSNPWTVVTDVSHDGVSCVRSGAIGHGGMTWLQTSMRKAGTISFWWKAACEEAEEEDGETYWYDYGSFLVDGVEKAKIAGNDTGWRKVEVDVPTGGKHVLRWEYHKDGATSYSPDCIWLDQVQWIPADGSGYTLTTPDPVPYSWLSGYGLGLDSDFESAAKQSFGKTDSNGRAMQVWQDYVAGTDPTNTMDFLRAVISFSNGMPKVSWTPNLNSNAEMRVYTVMGKTNLTDAAWMCPTNSGHRFFKVKVELP